MKITDEMVSKALNKFHAVRFASLSSDTRKVRREAMRAALLTVFGDVQGTIEDDPRTLIQGEKK